MAQGRRGAPRSERARAAIVTAAADELREHGFTAFSLERTAARAGVGKQTIYRWWSSKSAVLAEALLDGALLPEPFVPADTGALPEDLTAWLDEILAYIDEPGHRPMLRSLLAASADSDDLARALTDQLGSPAALDARLAAARARAEIGADPTDEAVRSALLGALVLRILEPSPPAARPTDDLIRALFAHTRTRNEGVPT